MISERFIFSDKDDQPELQGSFKGTIAKGILNAGQLLDAVATALKFPAYFGGNWNALFDCLRDFDWISEKKVCLIHQEIPIINGDDLQIYLEVLRDAVEDWNTGDGHELFVLFPNSSESVIRRILQ